MVNICHEKWRVAADKPNDRPRRKRIWHFVFSTILEVKAKITPFSAQLLNSYRFICLQPKKAPLSVEASPYSPLPTPGELQRKFRLEAYNLQLIFRWFILIDRMWQFIYFQ